MYTRSCGAVETSTDEARNSSTTRRLRRTRSESVRITMPASTLREQAGTSVREPSSSTTQTRQTFTGVSVSRKQSVGVSMRSEEHTSELQSRLHLVCRLLLEKKKNHAISSCTSDAAAASSSL